MTGNDNDPKVEYLHREFDSFKSDVSSRFNTLETQFTDRFNRLEQMLSGTRPNITNVLMGLVGAGGLLVTVTVAIGSATMTPLRSDIEDLKGVLDKHMDGHPYNVRSEVTNNRALILSEKEARQKSDEQIRDEVKRIDEFGSSVHGGNLWRSIIEGKAEDASQ